MNNICNIKILLSVTSGVPTQRSVKILIYFNNTIFLVWTNPPAGGQARPPGCRTGQTNVLSGYTIQTGGLVVRGDRSDYFLIVN